MILHYIVDGWFIVGEHGVLSLSWCDLFVFLFCFLLLNFTFEMCESFVLWSWYLESRSFSITPRQMFCIFFYCSVISRLSSWIISIQWSRIILYHSSSLRFLKYNFGDVWKIPYSHTIYIKLRYWMLLKRFWHEPTFSEFSFSTSWSMSHCIVLKRLILKICNCRCCVELWRWEIEKKV